MQVRSSTEAAKYGIDKKDIVIDVLTMTISSETDGAKVTLEASEREYGENSGSDTVLGVSNISFGLPSRPVVNSYFYAMAMQNGLTCRNHQSIFRRYDESLSVLIMH